ncbi:MAG TPA: SDR family oxidoreductase [Pseudolabrys sp.]|nr:SDR family oxidoreductase [Pseudolabrys sp.]
MSPAGKPVCLITGASSGIGAALAREFARHGHALVLTARRQAELDALADSIGRNGKPRPEVIAADIGTAAGIDRLAGELAGRGLDVAILVNNAGFGLLGPAAELDLAQQLAMIDLNVRALTDLTLRFTGSVIRHKGGILNVASIAGFMPGPGMAVYHASKAFAVSFSEAMHQELKAEGVRVTALCPGPVPTPFMAHAGIPRGYFPSVLARPAERVAREGYAGLMAGRRVVVPGGPNRLVTVLPRLLPRGLIAGYTAWRWRRSRRG